MKSKEKRDAPILNTPGKEDEALITPEIDLRYFLKQKAPDSFQSFPEKALIVFSNGMFDAGLSQGDGETLNGWPRKTATLKRGKKKTTLILSPLGAPAAASCLEETIAAGAREIIFAGSAGALDPTLAIGDLWVPDLALREEGTSYHYLPPSRFAEADPELTDRLAAALKRGGTACKTGPCWTTDAPYRETRKKVEAYGAEGIGAADMEAAALFAVGSFRGAAVAGVFYISDLLYQKDWKPGFLHKKVKSMKSVLICAALEALNGE